VVRHGGGRPRVPALRRFYTPIHQCPASIIIIITLRHQIEPRWGRYKLLDLRSADIEAWWPSLTRKDGKPMSEGTKRKRAGDLLRAPALRREDRSRHEPRPGNGPRLQAEAE
jgi:hypothetical protein